MKLFDFESDSGEYFDWSSCVHKSYKGLILPGSRLYAVHGDFGNMVFQSVSRPLFDIWFSNYEINKRRHTLARSDYRSVELSILIRSNIAYDLQVPLGRVQQKQSQFNLMHTNYMENKALFEKDAFYTTLDFHAKPLLLDQLYRQYPDLMYPFLNEVDAGRAALFFSKHLYASLPMLQLTQSITTLLAASELNTFLLDTSVLLLFGFAISCQLEMSSNKFRYDRKKEMEQALNAALAVLLSNLKTFLGIPYYARMAGMSDTAFKKYFRAAFGDSSKALWQKQRMESIFQKVVHSNLTFDAIADNYGYAGASQLSKAFKRYYQHSPSYFRAKL